ncbi:hypothetical protein M2322_000858 [Rhodoblastus acidophilus]|uniref:hypothetical protein n=1 Tax=Rhodoblastus acidophilus TaxID=1074 RepID=UPI002224C1FC|nr:hypothetical protein [Rhodoblastus acidophilus]MCW2315324.1 hypothetical protein [Rhodoblastus acidophilus]
MARSNAIPVYSAGTVAVATDGTVTGTGTKFTSPDNSTTWTIASGDLFVCGGYSAPVGSVSGDTSLTLDAWRGGAIAAGASYKIYRYGYASPSSAILGLLQQLKTLGTADNPFAGLAALVGSVAKLVFDLDASETKLALKIRSAAAGVTDSALVPAMTIDPATGAVGFPGGQLTPVVGFRNRLRNASFAINQRGVSGTVTLAPGAYGHDGVKAGAAGATYTFATSGIDTTLTVSAGSIILPVEAGMIQGGMFVLSHDGTAQVRVWQGTGASGSGSYAADPVVVSLTANTQANVEFGTGAVLRPQLEPGSTPTVFERRPPHLELMYCQRYYEVGGMVGHYIGTNASTSGYVSIIAQFKTVKRAGSVVVSISADGVAGRIRISDGPAYSTAYGINQADALNGFDVVSTGDVATRTMIGFGWTASAEI